MVREASAAQIQKSPVYVRALIADSRVDMISVLICASVTWLFCICIHKRWGEEYMGFTLLDGHVHGIGRVSYVSGDSYVGGMNRGMCEGKGIYEWKSGSRYEGLWENDKRQGMGTFIWSDKQQYTGQWIQGEKGGHGILQWPDGRKLEGEFENDDANGYGTFTFAGPNPRSISGMWKKDWHKFNDDQENHYMNWEGHEYYGFELIDGKLDGTGRVVYADGNIFIGSLVRGIREGHGKIFWKGTLSYSYDGEWKGGERSGKGFYLWRDGRTYQGEFNQNTIQGYGIYKWPDGRKLECIFEKDNANGIGTFTFSSGRNEKGIWKEDYLKLGENHWLAWCGSEYIGYEFVDHKATGSGKMIYSDGDFYTGSMINGYRDGIGEFHWAVDGDRYEGQWKKGDKHGEGTMYWKDGRTYSGGWDSDYASGHGRSQSANGSIVEGLFRKGWLKFNENHYQTAGGIQYHGESLDALPNGEGCMIWPDGDKWEGKNINGEREGLGTLYKQADQSFVEAEYHDDRRNGYGIKWYIDGKREVGRFHGEDHHQ